MTVQGDIQTLHCPDCEKDVDAICELFTDRLDHELEWLDFVCPYCQFIFEESIGKEGYIE